MGRPSRSAAESPATASIHSLQDFEDDDADQLIVDDVDESLPPSYEEVTGGPSRLPPAGRSNPLLNVDENPRAPSVRLIDVDYRIPGGQNAKSVFSSVRESATVTLKAELSTDAHELYTTIAHQINIPPRPQLVIVGTHTDSSRNKDNKKGESNLITDFNFCLDLAETLLTGWETVDGAQAGPGPRWHDVQIANDCDGVKRYRGTRLKTTAWKSYDRATSRGRAGAIRLPGNDLESDRPYTDARVTSEYEDEAEHRLIQPDFDNGQAGVDKRFNNQADQKAFLEWCIRFCNDPAPVKSFTLTRRVLDFNHQAVINCLKSHIRETNYRGNISMEVVFANGSITVYSPHWINKLRNHSVIFWSCIILQLWIITWPIIWLLEKRYAIVESSWYASRTVENQNGHIRSRKYARDRDEHALGEFWAPAVKQAAWARRQNREIVALEDAQRLQGLTTEQILVGVSSESQAEIERRRRMDRGEGTFVDSVVGLARGVSEVRQGWSMTMGWGGNT